MVSNMSTKTKVIITGNMAKVKADLRSNLKDGRKARRSGNDSPGES